MKVMDEKKYRTLDQVEAEYFRIHPEEIDTYMGEIFEAYAVDGDTASLLASLRVIAQVKGVTELASKTGMTRQGLQKALSGKGNPRLENINAILQCFTLFLIIYTTVGQARFQTRIRAE